MHLQEINKITGIIVDSAIEVHKHMGSGLLESAYEECLKFELESRGLKVQQQIPVPLLYKGNQLGLGYKIDLLVEDTVIVELKTVKEIDDVHLAQTLTYLKLMNLKVGLILNFNAELMKYGIRRVINEIE